MIKQCGCFRQLTDYTNQQEIPAVKETNDKNLVLSMSLLMRLFEWCHEDAKDDVAMHHAMEKIIAMNNGSEPLTIDDYEIIISDSEEKEEEEPSEDEAEGKVDAEFADYMQNIHDSYREGGITGDHAKACINNYCQDESMDNANDDVYAQVVSSPKFDMNINTDNGSIDDCPMCQNKEEETLSPELEQQIQQIINGSRI